MAGEQVVVVRLVDAGEDDYGDPLPSTETRTPVDGVAVAPLKDSEDVNVDGARILDAFTLYLPAGTDLMATDLVEVRGKAYKVDGVPAVWSNPFDGAARGGVEAIVRRS